MTTTTIDVETRRERSGLRQAVRAEAIKLATLRSGRWMMVFTVLGAIVITIVSTETVTHNSHSPGFDATNQSLSGLVLATLTVGVLGVLAMTSEYGSGTIRSSLAAVPSRSTLAAAKVLVLGGVALVLGEVLSFSCFGVGQLVLGAGGAPTASLSNPDVLRAVVLSGAALCLLGVLGLGLGMLLRHTAGGLAGYALITFLLPFAVQRIPGDPSRFTPIPILANSLSAPVQHGQISVPLGFSLIVLYSVVALVVGAARLLQRDA